MTEKRSTKTIIGLIIAGVLAIIVAPVSYTHLKAN